MALYLVRHAVAVGRSNWKGADELRPLTGKGRRQSDALIGLVKEADIRRVLTSPAVRCRETVVPLAEARQLAVRDTPALAEGALPAAAVELARELAGKKGDSVLCTHGDLVPAILRKLAHNGLPLRDEVHFAKGSTWELTVNDGHVVAGRYHPPPD